MDRWEEEIGIRPTKYDSRGPVFSKGEVLNYVCKEIETTNTFQTRNTKVIKDNVKEVIEVIDDVTEIFNNSIDSLAEKQRAIETQCKKVSSSVRDSANKLGDGLIRVEKMADFSKLERYVGLLERAATAFESLAELEKTGKLEKIALAIK
jgi:dGTP triphosphohydrolase